MRLLLILAAVAILIIAGPSDPFPGPTRIAVSDTSVDHSGGCRKSSPAGQCCHAGSKPLHCH